MRSSQKVVLAAVAAANLVQSMPPVQAADLRLTELFFNSPGAGPDRDEYFEIYNTAGSATSLADHYLVVLENETTGGNAAGRVEKVFDLGAGSRSTGTNGFAFFNMNTLSYLSVTHSTLYSGGNTYAPASNTLWTSLAGFSEGYTNSPGEFEASGGTFLLVSRTSGTTTPVAGTDNWGTTTSIAGVTYAALNTPTNFSVIDSVGVIAERDDVTTGTLFASVAYGVSGTSSPRLLSGAQYVNVELASGVTGFDEIEFLARLANDSRTAMLTAVNDPSTWVVANISNSAGSGLYDVANGNLAVSFDGLDPYKRWDKDFVVTNTASSMNYAPEPGTLSMLALAGLGLLRRKRRR